MMLVVGDANVLASGFVRRKPDTAPVQFLDAWHAGAFRLAVSNHLLVEVRRTLARPYFRRYLSLAIAEGFVTLLATEAELVSVAAGVTGVATSPADDLVLATAVSAQATYLVTGDIRFITRVGTYRGVTLVLPRDFITLLASERS